MAGNNPSHRNLPFLQRSWAKGVGSWQTMGSKHALAPSNGPDDHAASRQIKRRRLDEPSHPSPPLSDPSPRPQDYAGLSGLPVPPNRGPRALSFEVLKILHKKSSLVRFHGNTAPTVKGVTASRARCRVQLYHGSQRLYSETRECNVRSYKNPVGPSRMARICLAEPFVITEDKLLVPRRDPRGHTTFALGDSYSIVVDLESDGDANWPPFPVRAEGHDKPETEPRQWVLSATLGDIFTAARARIPLKQLPQAKAKSAADTDFAMEVDVRWSTGLSVRPTVRGQEKSIVAVDPFEEGTPTLPRSGHGRFDGYLGNGNGYGDHLNGINGMDGADGPNGTDSQAEDEDDDMDGDETPNRSLRTRESKNYNLKDLSAKAQGKTPRRRRRLEKWDISVDDPRVSYSLPAPGEHFTLPSFQCCLCWEVQQSMTQLRLHFLSHPRYTFAYDRRPGRGGNTVVVTHEDQEPDSPSVPCIYQLGLATLELDPAEYVNGDDSWLRSRYGPDNGMTLAKPKTAAAFPPQVGLRAPWNAPRASLTGREENDGTAQEGEARGAEHQAGSF